MNFWFALNIFQWAFLYLVHLQFTVKKWWWWWLVVVVVVIISSLRVRISSYVYVGEEKNHFLPFDVIGWGPAGCTNKRQMYKWRTNRSLPMYALCVCMGVLSDEWLQISPTRVLGLPQSVEIDQRPNEEFRQGFIGVPAVAQGKGEQATDSSACSLHEGGGQPDSLHGAG